MKIPNVHLKTSFRFDVAVELDPCAAELAEPLLLVSSAPEDPEGSRRSSELPASGKTPNSVPGANVQLPVVVGVVSPSSADWKSPKSPNDSNDESSSENEELKVNPSPGAAAESEKGPKPS